MRTINKIVIHNACTPEGKYFDIDDIRRWHTSRPPEGRGWSDVGYHYVVLLDGTIQLGRMLNVPGAHVGGHNSKSIGICYIGGMTADMKTPKDTRTVEQKSSIAHLLYTLKRSFNDAEIVGHCDLDPEGKPDCPGFDAKKEYETIKFKDE